jgi:cytochrome b561
VGARNGEHGYGWVTKTLHWSTVGLVLTQFVVGYVMAGDDSGGGHGRGRGHGSGHGRGGGDDDYSSLALLPVHVTLGAAILLVALVRVYWRVTTPWPPWATSLSHAERRIGSLTERTLLAMLFVIPLTGLVLVLGEDDDLLGGHIAAHVVFFLALAGHLSLVLGRGLRGRPVLLRRML